MYVLFIVYIYICLYIYCVTFLVYFYLKFNIPRQAPPKISVGVWTWSLTLENAPHDAKKIGHNNITSINDRIYHRCSRHDKRIVSNKFNLFHVKNTNTVPDVNKFDECPDGNDFQLLRNSPSSF